MRHIFIDCGSHDGCSIRKFRDTTDKGRQYEIYSFEPNSNLKKYYEELEDKQTHYDKAVWIYDGRVDFYVIGSTGGSTLEKTKNEHNSRKVGQPEKREVKCVDLAEWIKNNFKKEDFIILKMDIEGAEYEILEKFLNNDVIKYVNKIYIEFHNIRCGRTKADDSLLVEKLSKEGIKCDTTWDAMHKPYLKEPCWNRPGLPQEHPHSPGAGVPRRPSNSTYHSSL